MAEQGHLSKPPIIEAVLDLRVRRREGLTVEVFAHLEDEVGSAYTEKKVRNAIEAKVEVGGSASAGTHQSLSSHTDAFRYEAEAGDTAQIAQFRLDGFAYNIVGLYTNWEAVIKEAIRLWDIYQSVAEPLSLVRIGARFINRFTDFSSPYTPSTYLASPIPVPAEAKGRTEGFYTSVSQMYPEYEENTGAVINQIFGDIGTRQMRFVLDIDAFVLLQDEYEKPIPVGLEDIVSLLDRLRTIKNDLFFGSVTNEALQPYR